MGVFLEDRQLYPENVTGNVDYLKGNIFQKMTFYCKVRVETWYTLETNKGVYFADPRYNTPDWIVDRDTANAFAEFNIGDTIEVVNTTASANNVTLIISEKVSDGIIRVTDSLGAAITLTQNNAQSGKIFLDQESKGITLDYGLIENQEATNFNSKVDGNLMRYEYGNTLPIPSSYTGMSPVGRLSWQIGDGADVRNITTSVDRDNYRYIFEIEQDFYIHPFYLDNQIISLEAGNPPNYFDLASCLKHVFRVRAYRELQDPNVFQEGVFDEKEGNTGWFDEEHNGGNAEFSFTDLSYNNGIDTIARYQSTNITFRVDEIGTDTLGYSTINFIMLPEDASDYQNIQRLMQENYCFDRAEQTPGSPAVNGEQNGTGYQVIQNYEVTAFLGYTEHSLDINFGTDVASRIDSYTDKKFLLALTCVSPTETAEINNYVTLLIDVNQIGLDIPDNILTVTNQFVYHDQNDTSFVNSSGIIKVEDEIVMDSLVLLDQGTYTDAQINNVSLQIIAKDADEEAILQEKNYNFAQLPLSGAVRYINETTQNSFNVNVNEIRKEDKAYRNSAQDTGTSYAYRFQRPFLYRWEEWEQLLLGNIPPDFIDTAEPFNGVNQNWIRLAQLSGWSTAYRVSVEVQSGNTTKVINNDFPITEKDYVANPDWINEDIKIFDGATELVYSGNSYVFRGKDTTVKAEFEYAGGASIGASDVFMVARVIIKDQGTYITSQSFSSVWDRDIVSMFTSNTGLITITESAGVFTGEFELDHTKIPAGVLEFTFSASIMQKNEP